jgi:hypothetical protein
MYTIKAIRKDNGQWLNGYIWNGASCAYVIPHNLGVNHENNKLMATAYEVRKETICKPIGIDAYWYDKNGGHIVPIYENDVVQFVVSAGFYEGYVIKQFNKYMVQLMNGSDEFVDFNDMKDPKTNLVRCKIIGNKYDTLLKAEKTPVEADKDNAGTSEDCAYFERRETSYDVLSGHSDYQDYCTKNYEKKIIKCVHCTLCKQKGDK